MKIRSSRCPRLVLAMALCVVLFLANCQVVAEQPEEVAIEVELNEKVSVEDTDCNTENDKCLNPEADATITTTTNEDPNCPSREHVIRCAGMYLDTNKNGHLERAELQDAIDKLPWYGRGIIKILGSVDKMMSKCDIDGDGAISMDFDMSNNGHQCLATCFKRRAFKGAFFPDCE